MSDKNYFDEAPAARLRSWVLAQMMRGAGYGALLLFGTMILIYLIYLLGQLLPPESKTAPDPNNVWLIEASDMVRPA